MNPTVAHLLRSYTQNPHEHTALLVLADALEEEGPDGRAALLRKWVNEPGKRSHWEEVHGGPNAAGEVHHNSDRYKDERGEVALTTEVHAKPEEEGVFFTVRPRVTAPGEYVGIFKASKFLKLPHEEARSVADSLPNREEVHRLLDTHFGPDPRPKADHYHRDLNRTLGGN